MVFLSEKQALIVRTNEVCFKHAEWRMTEKDGQIENNTKELQEIKNSIEGFKNAFSKKINNLVDPSVDPNKSKKSRRAYKE